MTTSSDNSKPAATQPRKRRRWRPTFSLRTLFVLLTLLALVGWFISRCEHQRRVVAELGTHGAYVVFEEYSPPIKSSKASAPQGNSSWTAAKRYCLWTPDKVTAWTGEIDDQARLLLQLPSVHTYLLNDVGFGRSTGLSVAAARDLARHPGLRTLEVSLLNVDPGAVQQLASSRQVANVSIQTRLSDGDVRGLASMSTLRQLSLRFCEVTDEGAIALAETSSPLEYLDLFGAEVTDGGLQALSKIHTLRTLNLSFAKITAIGWQNVLFPNLEQLALEGTEVSEATAAVLARHPKLKNLDLSQTTLTDAGVEKLADSTSLEELYVMETRLTSASESAFLRMPKLRRLSVSGTKAFVDGVPDRLK